MGSRPDAVGDRHAVVVGMHRSGTSATAHTLVELGLSTPAFDDLIEAGPFNERGYWESRTISRFDERVLRHLGGTWSAPPRTSAGWELSEDDGMREIRSQAAELAQSMIERPPAVMKDPRLCLTLPLWRAVLSREPVVVLVFRDPVEVALSLQRRDGFPLTLGLALWHRYVRQSLASLRGLPAFVVEYGRALEEPRTWVDDLSRFLYDNGITPGTDRVDDATDVVAGGLRHHGKDDPSVSLASDLEPLLEILRVHVGGHNKWSTPELPAEPEWVDDVITLTWAGQAVTAAMLNARHELKWLKKSRLFRATASLWRVTRTGPVLTPFDEGTETADPGSNGAPSDPAVSG